MLDFSIVVPVLNEAPSLSALASEIKAAVCDLEREWEIIFVDDGSTDHSWSVIAGLADQNQRVRGIRFRKNFGKAAALRAGIEHSWGRLIITLDADLQDDPAEIPRMLAALEGRKERDQPEGNEQERTRDSGAGDEANPPEPDQFDLVSGWKQNRQDPLAKTLPSKVFNGLVGWLTGVWLHDHNCGFKIYRREIFDEVKLYGEMHRFIPVLASARGFRVAEIPVHHRPRQFGSSKYGWSRLPKGFLDLLTVSFLTGFNQRPQHLLGAIGGISFCLGGIGLTFMAIYWVFRMTMYPDWQPLHQRPIVIYSLGAMLLGAQMLSLGFLAELIIARGQEREAPFSIRESTPYQSSMVSVHADDPSADDDPQADGSRVRAI